ncbi:MAG: hypothetical protein QXO70_04830 [Candidatus Pacearchaeota archaeon]
MTNMAHKLKQNKKDMEILKWHYAGKPHSWIAEKYGVPKRYIEKLVLEYGKG